MSCVTSDLHAQNRMNLKKTDFTNNSDYDILYANRPDFELEVSKSGSKKFLVITSDEGTYITKSEISKYRFLPKK